MSGFSKDFVLRAKTINEQPEDITAAYVSVALMPNGEVICLGKTIGRYKDFEGYIFAEEVKGSDNE
jgi:hypothetical protein